MKVKVVSRSQSFEVKVIPESNGNVFQFLSQSGWLAFARMLIFLVLKSSLLLVTNSIMVPFLT